MLAKLCCANCPSHRQGAEQQHAGVDRTKLLVQKRAAKLEDLRIAVSIQRVRTKHAAEKENFRNEKQPHPKLARVVLLLGIVEMVGQPTRMFMVMVIAVVMVCGGMGLLNSSHVL
jgi:hypothetical protein